MSDEEPDVSDAEPESASGGDVDDTNDSGGDEQPEMEKGEMVDVAAIAGDVEAEAGAGDQDGGDDQDSDDDLDTPEADDSLADEDRVTPGEIYCNVLGMAGATARLSYGEADAPRDELMDEYSELAQDIEIDRYLDQLVEERGGIDELSPEQAVVATTVLWCGMVVMDDPAVLRGIREEAA